MPRSPLRSAFVGTILLALGALLALPGVAAAAPPVRVPFTVDETFSRPDLAANCGIAEVIETDHGTGVLTFHVDQTGTTVFELDRWHLDNRYTNPVTGKTVSFLLRQTQRWITNPDGSTTVTITGVLLRAVAPRQGLVEGLIGHFVLTISPEGEGSLALVGGQDNTAAFFGTPGTPGTLCALLV
jgi:hypothetical protein